MLSGHLGSTVSALVDGQLDEESAERAWQHVQHCPPCRRLVEHETWVKRQLAQIAETPRAETPSDRFLGALLDLDPAAVAWAETQELEDRGRTRRRAGIALVGVGSVSAAVLGLSTLGASPLDLKGPEHTPATSLRQATSTPTRAVIAPAASVHGRLRGWTLEQGQDGVAHAHSVADPR
jgi:predicted anti-sigma-YlaC factor YlaD